MGLHRALKHRQAIGHRRVMEHRRAMGHHWGSWTIPGHETLPSHFSAHLTIISSVESDSINWLPTKFRAFRMQFKINLRKKNEKVPQYYSNLVTADDCNLECGSSVYKAIAKFLKIGNWYVKEPGVQVCDGSSNFCLYCIMGWLSR